MVMTGQRTLYHCEGSPLFEFHLMPIVQHTKHWNCFLVICPSRLKKMSQVAQLKAINPPKKGSRSKAATTRNTEQWRNNIPANSEMTAHRVITCHVVSSRKYIGLKILNNKSRIFLFTDNHYTLFHMHFSFALTLFICTGWTTERDYTLKRKKSQNVSI